MGGARQVLARYGAARHPGPDRPRPPEEGPGRRAQHELLARRGMSPFLVSATPSFAWLRFAGLPSRSSAKGSEGWGRGWDSNPRAAFGDKTLSRRPRYDHFGTSPFELTLSNAEC